MIITKQGRRMFPPVRVNFSLNEQALASAQLNPRDKYQVLMDILPYDSKRYRYAYHKSSWQQAGKADPPSPTKLFLHPDGPFTLEQLKRQVISFEKIKLTNNDANKHGYIVLNSMHKYQPRIHLVLWRGKDTPNLANEPIARLDQETHKVFIFNETIFTAVTAYQNHSITKLKIDSNPFAKGFRDSSRLTDLELESMQDLISAEGQCPFSPPRAPPPGFPHFLFAAAAAQQQQQHMPPNSGPLGKKPDDALLRERTMMALDSFFQQQQQQQQHGQFHHNHHSHYNHQAQHQQVQASPNEQSSSPRQQAPGASSFMQNPHLAVQQHFAAPQSSGPAPPGAANGPAHSSPSLTPTSTGNCPHLGPPPPYSAPSSASCGQFQVAPPAYAQSQAMGHLQQQQQHRQQQSPPPPPQQLNMGAVNGQQNSALEQFILQQQQQFAAAMAAAAAVSGAHPFQSLFAHMGGAGVGTAPTGGCPMTTNSGRLSPVSQARGSPGTGPMVGSLASNMQMASPIGAAKSAARNQMMGVSGFPSGNLAAEQQQMAAALGLLGPPLGGAPGSMHSAASAYALHPQQIQAMMQQQQQQQMATLSQVQSCLDLNRLQQKSVAAQATSGQQASSKKN